MNRQEIEALFWDAIKPKAIYNKVEGLTRNMVYNWQNKRGKNPPRLAEMLWVLHELNLIKIEKNDGPPQQP